MQSRIEITAASGIEDAKITEKLARKIWTEHYTPLIGLSQVEYMLDNFQNAQRIYDDITTSGYTYFMACCNGEYVGYCAIKPKADRIFLSKIYVDKMHRGKGIARMFVDRVVEVAKTKGCADIYLTVNKGNVNSIAAYKKMGFEVVEEMVTDIGEGFVMDDFKMAKAIN